MLQQAGTHPQCLSFGSCPSCAFLAPGPQPQKACQWVISLLTSGKFKKYQHPVFVGKILHFSHLGIFSTVIIIVWA